MRKKKETLLIDYTHQHRFSISSSGQKIFALNSRKGLLKNSINSTEIISESKEFATINQVEEYIHTNKANITFDKINKTQFMAGKILRDNQLLLDTLEKLGLYKWELISKNKSINRYVIDKDSQCKKNIFNHFSHSINFKLFANSKTIELGVGSTDFSKINRDGLTFRLKDIVNNNRDAKKIRFKDKVPIVLDSGDGGILFHEIIGHSLEADYIVQKLSPFSINNIGEEIFPKALTVNTFDGKDLFFAGLSSDDEGSVINTKELITDGRLNGILSDNFHKDILQLNSAGYARVEDFTKLYQPRMHSLFIKPGKFNHNDIIESVNYGVFVKEFDEGKVFFANNTFSLSVKESYLIEKGRITAPLGSIIIRGNIREVLNSITMIGNNFRYDRGVSYCYKNGQTLNVRVGQPTVKVEGIIISET